MKSERMARLARPGLYGFSGEAFTRGRGNLECVRRQLEAGVDIIQFREKDMPRLEQFRQCLRLRDLCAAHGALFIVNDYVDLARAVEADGVHLGQDDLPPEVAREQLGDAVLIGISTHRPAQGRDAETRPVDYIGVGPLYATQTKRDVCAPVGLAYLEFAASNLALPFVAIGGIKRGNLQPVLDRGAKRVAMITEILEADDIGARVREVLERIRAAAGPAATGN